MATLAEIYALRYSAGHLNQQVVAAIAKGAQDVLNEDPLTVNHNERVAWAKSALKNTQSMADSMMWAVLGNASIQTTGNNTPDNDVLFVVNSLINTFALNTVNV